ncbi:MAG: hypothetical protein ACHREM_04685 [Polyangiales bacterium]
MPLSAYVEVLLTTAHARTDPANIVLDTEYGDVTPDASTRERAIELAREILVAMPDDATRRTFVPRFDACGNGDIDLVWEPKWVLLVAVHRGADGEVEFYGQVPTGASIEGKQGRDAPVSFLATWLVERRREAEQRAQAR